MKRWREILRDESGSEAVEMVICMPILVIMLSYMICFCQLFYASQTALNAADSGARLAIISDNAGTAKSQADSAAQSYVQAAGMGITYESGSLSYSSWQRGNICDYTVTVKVKTAMPMPGQTFDRQMHVKGASHMMIEVSR